MFYLVVLVLLAGGAILKLWLHQRRHARMDSVDEFWTGLEVIATQPVLRPRATRTRQTRPVASRPIRHAGSRPAPLDPARREAAKRRIEARRRAMRRVAG